jgi:DNA repair exonuclease SbcCD ATPase subunit
MAMETGWLADLEEKVRAAVERLGALREENQTLAKRVQELETELAARRGPGAPEPEPDGEDAEVEAAEAWQEERRQIRAHVERLTALLEELLAAAEEKETA